MGNISPARSGDFWDEGPAQPSGDNWLLWIAVVSIVLMAAALLVVGE